ncbi:MAG: hypothetical protein JO121_19020 [Deltaproteobacteria bacterium]|nr:hypothetical protein [Deltaproteobacteria bacterium]
MTSNLSRPVPRVRLPADFAERVVGRVEKIERRRSIRRSALATTAALGIALAGVFTWRYPSIWSPPPSIAQPSPVGSTFANASSRGTEPAYAVGQEQPVVDLLLPDGYVVTNFVESSGESGWHAYDSWWGSSS